MTEYLSYTFEDSAALVETFDELPLWSAPFGLMLLKHLDLKPNLNVVDLGSGAGFPLLELAERLGKSSKIFGVDPWKNANDCVRRKITNYQLSHVELLEISAEHLPFENDSIDLIVSNLGINNFENPSVVFKECHRVLKGNGKLALTTNVTGHWKEFYSIFQSTLTQMGLEKYREALLQEENHRGTLALISKLFESNGLRLTRIVEDKFEMKFLDGTAFLNHHFVKLGWLSSWMELFPKNELQDIFAALEKNLNDFASRNNGLTLSVPMAFFEGEKTTQ